MACQAMLYRAMLCRAMLCRAMLCRAVLCLVLSLSPAMALPDPTRADVESMAQLFDTVCLRGFPDDAAVDGAMAGLGALPLTQPEVRTLLHEDPGRGWRVRQPEATYLVTVEAPPWNACAVRRMTRAGMPTLEPFSAVAGRYAGARQRRLTPAVRQSVRTERGLDIEGLVQQVPGRADGRVTDSLMLLLTDYHGTYDGPLAADSAAPGIEVRFVHQLRSMGAPP